ncbi:hypothetical protein [Paenibacillus sp. MDMC362]|uniref:hypothetical protein n=1 Tax=Paenibacillus sp. MDMC362 TaxID=2977365 RepID=UPI000DC41B66|nr:hypothetical protein [Paenibacillus sp. MDMC362]RAR41032.1 hypothetical protein DP091_25935 [Paenibacillus sp. MDMC362]
MTRIMTTHSFDGETYKCYECDKILSESQIEEWRCVFCRYRVSIDAPSLSRRIMRKYAHEVTFNNMILMSDTKFYEIYKVEEKKGIFQFNIKGFGKYKQSSDDWVNCLFEDE